MKTYEICRACEKMNGYCIVEGINTTDSVDEVYCPVWKFCDNNDS